MDQQGELSERKGRDKGRKKSKSRKRRRKVEIDKLYFSHLMLRLKHLEEGETVVTSLSARQSTSNNLSQLYGKPLSTLTYHYNSRLSS